MVHESKPASNDVSNALVSTPPASAPSSSPTVPWPPVGFGSRLLALVTVQPIASQPAPAAPEGSAVARVRVLRWNYARLFAFAWTGLFLFMSLRNAPRQGGPTTAETLFMMAGLLYIVYVGLNMTRSGYWQGFFVERDAPSAEMNRLALLGLSLLGGLLQVAVAAVLVGVVIAVGNLMR